MRHDREVRRVADAYQLGLPTMPATGRSGELLGRGTGTSLEFQEYREYLPGDDVRHVDWAAYARSDSLMVRLFREEISPRTEILLDASRSMNTGDGRKARVAKQLATVFAMLAGRLGGRTRLMPLDDSVPVRVLGHEELDSLESLPMESRGTLPDMLEAHAIRFQRQSVRIVISDFLYPHDPDVLLRRLATGASATWVLQVLTAWESDPTPLGGRRLIDAETESAADLVVDRRTIAAYNERLERLREGLVVACRRAHATFAVLVADRGLETLCREELVAAEILRPT